MNSEFFRILWIAICFLNSVTRSMFCLSLLKIESIYELAAKLHKHCTNHDNDVLKDLIAKTVESEIDSGVISPKFDLRLDVAVPRHLYFNHILFLSVLLVETNRCSCINICPSCAFNKLLKCNEFSHRAPWGGLIGPGMTVRTHSFMAPLFPILKLHAVFHDAYGHLYQVHKKGPGYTYALPVKFVPSCFWLGHITGFIFFLWLKIRHYAAFRYFESLLK